MTAISHRALHRAPSHKGQASNNQRGFSLLEVLVSVLLISLGLLGVAGLSAATFGYNKASQLRLTGLSLVNDFADRARVNVYGYDLGGYGIPTVATTAPGAVTFTPDLDTSVAANAITAAQNVAQADRRDFLLAVAARLPQGDAVVVNRPTAGARNMEIWLLWQEPQTGTNVNQLAADALFQAGQRNCPSSLTPAERLIYSCMYFKVGL